MSSEEINSLIIFIPFTPQSQCKATIVATDLECSLVTTACTHLTVHDNHHTLQIDYYTGTCCYRRAELHSHQPRTVFSPPFFLLLHQQHRHCQRYFILGHLIWQRQQPNRHTRTTSTNTTTTVTATTAATRGVRDGQSSRPR